MREFNHFERLPFSIATSIQSGEVFCLPRFSTRSVRLDDLDALVDIDIKGFKEVYDEQTEDRAELRNELRDKFETRLHRIDPDWVRVVEMDGELCGFMVSCPTSKTPEEFESWEKTTDDGTLQTTYNPDGSYIYIVTLTMPRPEGADESPKNMLVVDAIGKLIQTQKQAIYFESRLPGLRKWVLEQCDGKIDKIKSLSPQRLELLAQEYSKTPMERQGKEGLLDPHLDMYKKIGCRFVKLAADAYQDGPSMNFGMVAIYDNPLPKSLRKSKLISYAAGSMVRAAGRSHRLVKRAFSA